MKSWIFSCNINTDHSSLHTPHHRSSSVTASPSSGPPSRHHSLSEIMVDENISHARYIIKKWEVDAGKFERFSTLFSSDRKEAKKLLQATMGLQHAMNFYVKLTTNSAKLIGAQELMQIAMKRLMFEFYTILSANRKNLDSESFSSGSSVDGVSENQENMAATPPRVSEAERSVEDLKSIAECMIACGYGKECINIYRIIRKSIVDETLYHLGIERLSIDQLKKMEWTNLETKIKRWLHAVKIAVETLFHQEKILCDTVFSSSEKIAEACFAGVSRDAASDLFAFAENVCKCKKVLTPEKIFRLLDLYEAISDLLPDNEYIFSNKLLTAVRSQVAATQMKLGEAIRTMLGQFEEAIQKDTSKPPPGGGVHPLTRYVMNFLVFLGDYSSAVSEITEDWSVKVRSSSPSKYRFSSPASGGEAGASTVEISRRLDWLILVLLCKLDGKAAAYDDIALSYLFLANNLNYVVSKVRNSNLELLIGHDWIQKHEMYVKKYSASYERIGWSNVISALPENSAAVLPPLKLSELFEKFCVSFQEACKQQSSWAIPDPKLREAVKTSLAKRLVSGYRVFYKQRRKAGLIVRYAPEDLDNYLSDLFCSASVKSYTASHKVDTVPYSPLGGR
ncbi:hypothetical protein C2S52_016600 [Perilla frutescens var. hirtella]|nr:hypothetical protein C2S52_016600 [Perilla frutescens var. hirtella]